MTVTQKWLDAARAARGFTSDYQLAKALGVTTQRISNYRGVEQRGMDDDLAVKVAELAEAPAARVLAELRAEKSTSDATRAVWLQVARNAGRIAACLAVVGLAMHEPTARAGLDILSAPLPSLTLATTSVSPFQEAGHGKYYVNCAALVAAVCITVFTFFSDRFRLSNPAPIATLPSPTDALAILVTAVTVNARQNSNFFRNLEK